ncbi:energy transducer TonB [Paracoccus sp. J39]|uniref:energy transducer TonB family protein n=1 Tax=Paracoccus sp. J39 TaxID=935848 RepID=UPI00048AB775|nr:energy transducer TonB [Paracoccus sp. J39]
MSWTPSPALREGALWGTAAVVVLAAHLGGGLWIMQRAEAAAPPGLPDPVFVDLAPMPEAAAPEDEFEMPEMAEAEPEPEPEPEPELAMPPLQELEPLADMNSLFPPPPDAVVLQKSERPPERPEREPEPEPKVVEKQPEPKKREKKEKAPEQQPSRQAATQVRAPQSERTAAPQIQAGTPSPRQVANWQSKVQAAVARHMQRTRFTGRGASVTVTVRFSVDPSGRVAGAQLANSTGDARIDAALSRQASSMPRMPAPPSGKTTALVLPVKIVLR